MSMRTWKWALCFALVPAAIGPTTASGGATKFGRISGLPVKAEFLTDSTGSGQWNRIRLLRGMTYVDGDGVVWPAPSGTISDGASIPRPLWSIVGSPYTGPYLAAALIHDVGCDQKSRGWEATHLAFYHAMRASNVPQAQAMTLFSAVYLFGPRWGHMEHVTVRGSDDSHVSRALNDSIDRRRTARLATLPPGSDMVVMNSWNESAVADTLVFSATALLHFTPPLARADSTDLLRLKLQIAADSAAMSENALLTRLRALDKGLH